MSEDTVQFKTGGHRPADRFEAVKEWLTAQGFDINEIPLNSLVVIEDGKVTVEVYARNAAGRLKNIRNTHTRALVSEPSDLVLGVMGAKK